MKKEIYILIGPAAIGKSTFVKRAGFPEDKLSIINRDDVVGEVSKRYNLSYDDLYHFPPHDSTPSSYIPGFEQYGRVIESPHVVAHLHPYSYEYLNSVNAEINYRFYNEFQTAIRDVSKQFIVVDRVHMRHYERAQYFPFMEYGRENYVVTGVIFNFKDEDTLDLIEQASAIRTKQMIESGQRPRTVTRAVQEKMLQFYEEPTLEEGFNSIIQVNTLPDLRMILEINKTK